MYDSFITGINEYFENSTIAIPLAQGSSFAAMLHNSKGVAIRYVEFINRGNGSLPYKFFSNIFLDYATRLKKSCLYK